MVAAVFIFPAPGFAETIRLTAWKWELAGESSAAPDLAGSRIQEAAAALGKLNSDVILLQQVPDWQTCARLAQALKPANYNVLVCSAFAPSNGGPGQVAILAKQKAYFSWSESWQRDDGVPSGGGFAFAAVRAGNRRVGLFSVLFDDTMRAATKADASAARQPGSAPSRQWQAELDSFGNWVANRIETVAAAGAFPGGKAGSPEDRAYIDGFLGAPLEHAITLAGERTSANLREDYVLAQVTPGSRALSGVVLDRAGVTCDLVVNPAAPVVAKPAPPATNPVTAAAANISTATPSRKAMTQGGRFSARTWWLLLPPVVLVVGVAAIWRRRKRAASRRLAASVAGPAMADAARSGPASAATVVFMARTVTDSAEEPKPLTPASVMHVEGPGLTHTQSGAPLPADERSVAMMRTGLFALWSQWLKEKLVRKLLAERAEMLGTQQAATFKAMAVEERLARVELQIQHQYKAYERRVEELTRELLAAKDENRELIRVQIAQVKAEMDAVRARALAQSKKD
jgi:hypothetical protein